jgi:hypothetical protein
MNARIQWLVLFVILLRELFCDSSSTSTLVNIGNPTFQMTQMNKTIDLYTIAPLYSESKNVFVFSKDPKIITQEFIFYYLQTRSLMNDIFRFNYTDINGTAFVFELQIYSSMDVYLLLPTCSKMPSPLNEVHSSFIQCTNNKSNIRVEVSTKVDNLRFPFRKWDIIKMVNETNLVNLYTFNISVQYIPNYFIRNETDVMVNLLNMKFSSLGPNSTYIGVKDSTFQYSTCPRNCAECVDTVCTLCNINFALSANNTCFCSKNQYSDLVLLSNLTSSSALDLQQNFYLNTDRCEDSSSSLDAASQCTANLKLITSFGSTAIKISPTFYSENIVEAKIESTSPANIKFVDATCISNSFVVFTSKLQKADSNEDLRLDLSKEILFAFDSPISLNLRDYYFCNTYSINQYNYLMRNCPLTISILYRSSLVNQTITEFDGSFVIVENLDSNTPLKKAFVPIYKSSDFLKVNTTKYASAIVCLDVDCYLPINSNNMTNQELIYITVSISDPVFITVQPAIIPHLYINQESRKSLMLDFYKKQENVYTAIISLDSSEIKNATSIVLNLDYNYTSFAQPYINTESVNFLVFVDSQNIIPIPDIFINSIGFFWIVITFGAMLVCMILGCFFYCCSKCCKKENFEEENYVAFKGPGSRLQEIELIATSGLPGKSNRSIVSMESKLKANKILQSLM